MVALEELREQALQKLARHYAAGDLHLTTLEHRVKEALAAESPDEMTGTTWDLPALENSAWERVRLRIVRPPHPDAWQPDSVPRRPQARPCHA